MTEPPNLHLNLETCTRDLRAETWHLKVSLPHPVSGFPLSAQPLTANREYLSRVGLAILGRPRSSKDARPYLETARS